MAATSDALCGVGAGIGGGVVGAGAAGVVSTTTGAGFSAGTPTITGGGVIMVLVILGGGLEWLQPVANVALARQVVRVRSAEVLGFIAWAFSFRLGASLFLVKRSFVFTNL